MFRPLLRPLGPGLAVGLTWFATTTASAADYHVDPATGSANGSGSAEDPWNTLEQVAAEGRFETVIQSGDTVWLHDGYHGVVVLDGLGYDATVTVAAEDGHAPRLGRIEVAQSTHVTLRGLQISPEYAAQYSADNMVRLDGSNLALEDCTIQSVADASPWGVPEWNDLAANGVQVGGQDNLVIGNHIRNVNFGITVSASDSVIEDNVVDGFAGDGMRGLGDRTVFAYNVIKNNVDVNDNHDDGFQSWSNGPDGVGSAEVHGIELRGNVFINYEDPNQALRGPLQGIGCFDGTFVDWVVENNIVIVDHWHGITLLGARNVSVVNNTVLAPPGNEIGPPWIAVDDHKDGTPPSECLVGNNLTTDLANADGGVVEDTNLLIEDTEALFVDVDGFDLRLLQTATAVDAANASIAPALDADRIPRPQGRGVDLGAYEWHEDDVVPTTGGDETGGDTDDGPSTSGSPMSTSGDSGDPAGTASTTGPDSQTSGDATSTPAGDTDTESSADGDGGGCRSAGGSPPIAGLVLLLLGGALRRPRRR